jgi:hypothetical protein
MDIAPIKTRRDYRHALKRIKRLMTAKRGAPEGDCLDVLVTLLEARNQAARFRSFLIRDSAGIPSPSCNRQIILSVSDRLRLSRLCRVDFEQYH